MPQRCSASNCSLLPSMITGSSAGSVALIFASAASKSSKDFSCAGSTPALRSLAMFVKTPVDWPLWAMP